MKSISQYDKEMFEYGKEIREEIFSDDPFNPQIFEKDFEALNNMLYDIELYIVQAGLFFEYSEFLKA